MWIFWVLQPIYTWLRLQDSPVWIFWVLQPIYTWLRLQDNFYTNEMTICNFLVTELLLTAVKEMTSESSNRFLYELCLMCV